MRGLRAVAAWPGQLWAWPHKTRYGITGLTFAILLLIYAMAIDRYFPEDSYTAIRGTAVLGSAVYDAAHSTDIAVLEINDRYLDFVGESWPPSYAAYAAMLDDVAMYQPASVFVDIAFIHTRPDASLPQLIDSICRLHAQKIRVYLAGLEDETLGTLRLRPELETESARACYTIVGIRYDPAPNTKLALTYPLVGNGQAHTPRDDAAWLQARQRIPSAAYAIARDQDRDGTLPLELRENTMALNWSLQPHPAMDWQLWEGCTTRTHWLWELLPRPLRAALLDGFPRFLEGWSVQAACPSHRHVPLNLIADPQTNQARDWLQRHLHAKHVLIGASVTGVNDLIQSPIHGDLPGIYLHAMALDNLLTHGRDYKLPGRLHDRNWLVFFALALLLGLVNYRVYTGLHRWLERRSAHSPHSADLPYNAQVLRWQPSGQRMRHELSHLLWWLAAKLVEIVFSIVLALAVFYVMQRTTAYAIQDLAQLIGVVLALQWTGVTAHVVNAVLRVLCVPQPSSHPPSGETP